MLDFMGYPDKVLLIKSSTTLDEWGLPIKDGSKLELNCRLIESVELIQLQGEKSKDYITKYTVSLPNTVDINYNDVLEINGATHKVVKIKKSRDMLGNIMFCKVWV